jgi:multicomponent Na+:H+ antiporter subunit E
MTRLAPLLFSTLFRLLLWQLLTADLSVLNVMIGLALALLIPRARSRPVPMAELWQGLGRALLAVPQAYGEAFALIGARRLVERDILQPARTPTVPLLVFLDVFRITLTPFTIALGLEMGPDGAHYRIHDLRPSREAER